MAVDSPRSVETSESKWGSVPLWRKVFYGIGALIIGSTIAALPTAVVDLLITAISDTEALRAVSGIVGLAVLIAAVVGIYRAMRQDYEYVHSAEYARRNPGFSH